MDISIMSAAASAEWTAGANRAAVCSAESFAGVMETADTDRQEAYIAHLRSKYGAHFRIESIPHTQEALERAGKGMSGDDVVIAPNIVEKMADDPEVAAYYEGVIDHCFDSVPEDKARFAAIGLTFEPCGVVVHEDGTVTYICGGGDSPERVAQVNAINAARDAKRAAQRRVWIEASRERSAEARRVNELLAQRQALGARMERSQAFSAQTGSFFQRSATVAPAAPTPDA